MLVLFIHLLAFVAIPLNTQWPLQKLETDASEGHHLSL